jgi:hypothetical protein
MDMVFSCPGIPQAEAALSCVDLGAGQLPGSAQNRASPEFLRLARMILRAPDPARVLRLMIALAEISVTKTHDA